MILFANGNKIYDIPSLCSNRCKGVYRNKMGQIKSIDIGCYQEGFKEWTAQVCHIYVVKYKYTGTFGLLICGNKECTLIDSDTGGMTYSSKEWFEDEYTMIRDVTAQVSIKVE